MIPIKFQEHNTVFAKDQPEYLPLPAHVDREGVCTFCWKLSWRERFVLLFTGRLWHQVLTFKQLLQPQKILVNQPTLAPKSERQKVEEFHKESRYKVFDDKKSWNEVLRSNPSIKSDIRFP